MRRLYPWRFGRMSKSVAIKNFPLLTGEDFDVTKRIPLTNLVAIMNRRDGVDASPASSLIGCGTVTVDNMAYLYNRDMGRDERAPDGSMGRHWITMPEYVLHRVLDEYAHKCNLCKTTWQEVIANFAKHGPLRNETRVTIDDVLRRFVDSFAKKEEEEKEKVQADAGPGPAPRV